MHMNRLHLELMQNNLAVEVDDKGHTDRDFIFEKKRQ